MYEAAHVVLDVTDTTVVPPPDGAAQEDGATDTVGTAACDTVTFWVADGVPVVVVNVTIALRVVRVVFPLVLKITSPFPEPVVVDSITQVSLDDTDQDAFEEMVNLRSPPTFGESHKFCGTDNVGTAPDWVTLIDRVTWVFPHVDVMVTVADRANTDGFGGAVNVTGPVPLPESGETPNQGKVEVVLTDTDHVVFDETVTGMLPPDPTGVHDDCDNEIDGVTRGPVDDN